MKIDTKILNNYLFNLLYQLVTLLTPLITIPYLSRVLGAENLGIYSYTLSVATYFMVIGSLGFPIHGQREITCALDDLEKRSVIFCEIALIQFFSLISICFLYVTVVLFFADHKIEFLAQTFSLLSYAFGISWFFNGLENFKVTVLKNIIVKLVSVASIFIFVKSEGDLILYTVLMGLSNLVGNLYLFWDLKNYVQLRYVKIRLSLKKHFRSAFLLGVPFCLTTMYSVLDKTLLAYFDIRFSEIGFYDLSQKVLLIAMSLTMALPTVLLPRLSYLAAHNKKEIHELLNNGLQLLCLLALPLVGGLIVIGDMIIPWFFGSGYEKVGSLIQISAPLVLLMSLNNLLGNQYLVALKKEKLLTVVIGIGLIVNVSLNFLLIELYGVIGAVCSTLVAEILKIAFLFYYLRQDVDFHNLAQAMIKYMVLSAVVMLIILIIKIGCSLPYTLCSTIFLILIAVLVYLISLRSIKDPFIDLLNHKVSGNNGL